MLSTRGAVIDGTTIFERQVALLRPRVTELIVSSPVDIPPVPEFIELAPHLPETRDRSARERALRLVDGAGHLMHFDAPVALADAFGSVVRRSSPVTAVSRLRPE